MPRVHPALASVVSVLMLGAACADSPTVPPRPQLAPIPTEPSFGILTPFIFPAGADWGHYFVSFNPDRHLSVKVIHYPDNSVRGQGVFIIPGVGIGRLRVTTLVSTSDDCVPWGTPCTDPNATNIPESSTVSGDGMMGPFPLTFTLELKSNLWPPQGWTPGTDPGTAYDTATLWLTICVIGTCTAAPPTTFYGELHHEPT
jgi:hypothetical protein